MYTRVHGCMHACVLAPRGARRGHHGCMRGACSARVGIGAQPPPTLSPLGGRRRGCPPAPPRGFCGRTAWLRRCTLCGRQSNTTMKQQGNFDGGNHAHARFSPPPPLTVPSHVEPLPCPLPPPTPTPLSTPPNAPFALLLCKSQLGKADLKQVLAAARAALDLRTAAAVGGWPSLCGSRLWSVRCVHACACVQV